MFISTSTNNYLLSINVYSDLIDLLKHEQFQAAIICLKQVKEKYCPREMLNQIVRTFEFIDEAKSKTFNGKMFINSTEIIKL